MNIIRQCSEIKGLFPEYFFAGQQNVVLSKYTLIQKVSSDKAVLYSFITDAIVLLTQNECEQISTMTFQNEALFNSLQKLGFFVGENIDEYSLIIRQRQDISSKRSNTIKVVIVPTTSCNARCNYCIGMNNPVVGMTQETANKVVDYIVERSQGYENIKFDWYGGEPLLKRELITFICDNVYRRLPHISFSSVITSNLACFDNQVLKQAIENWHVRKINITIDGTEKEHNARKAYLIRELNGYKHTIDCIRSILDEGISIFCRYNIDRNNIDQLKSVLNDLKPFFDDKNFYFFVSPLRGEDWQREFYQTTEYNDLFYRTGVMLNEAGVHNTIDSFVPKFKNGFCLAKSEHCIVIGPNGAIYRCNLDKLVQSNATGSIFSGLKKNSVYKHFISLELDDDCKKCAYLPLCQGGCPVQAKNASSSNNKCNKFIFKTEATSRLLAEYYV